MVAISAFVVTIFFFVIFAIVRFLGSRVHYFVVAITLFERQKAFESDRLANGLNTL